LERTFRKSLSSFPRLRYRVLRGKARRVGEQGKPPAPDAQWPAWEKLTDQELLELLPRISAVGEQTEASLKRLVTILRERRVTWARIGAALQVTRQSAWERFSGEE
jgi:hypothetical protein